MDSEISPATILDLTRRAADAVQSEYDTILNRVRERPYSICGRNGGRGSGKEALDMGIHHTGRDFCRDSEEPGNESPDRGSDEEIQGNDRV